MLFFKSTKTAVIFPGGLTFTSVMTKKIDNISWDWTNFMENKIDGLISAGELMAIFLKDLKKKILKV